METGIQRKGDAKIFPKNREIRRKPVHAPGRVRGRENESDRALQVRAELQLSAARAQSKRKTSFVSVTWCEAVVCAEHSPFV